MTLIRLSQPATRSTASLRAGAKTLAGRDLATALTGADPSKIREQRRRCGSGSPPHLGSAAARAPDTTIDPRLLGLRPLVISVLNGDQQPDSRVGTSHLAKQSSVVDGV